jgi:PAS domain S-box-containing protein
LPGSLDALVALGREALASFAFDHAPVGMAIASLDYRFLAVNPALCQMLGYTAEELTGLTFMDITHPADWTIGVDVAERVFRGEMDSFTLEKRYLRKDRTAVRVRLTGTALRDASGAACCGIALIEELGARAGAGPSLDQLAHARDLLPICASCKSVREEGASWTSIESFIEARSEVRFTHGICPDCAARAEPGMPSPIPQRRKCVMVVDGDGEVRASLAATLEGLGYDAVTAPDGEAALDLAGGRGDIDLVLLDLHVRRVEAAEVVARLRATPRLAAIPVVLVSDESAAHARAHTLHMGARSCLLKPVSAASLSRALGALLSGEDAPPPNTPR